MAMAADVRRGRIFECANCSRYRPGMNRCPALEPGDRSEARGVEWKCGALNRPVKPTEAMKRR